MSMISQEQLADATGQIHDVADYEGVAFEQTDNYLYSPAWWEIQQALDRDGAEKVFALDPHEASGLAGVPNTRVMVGVNTANGAAFLPGVVLPDSTYGNLRFGCLYAAEDVRRPDFEEAKLPLNPFQQMLLGKIAAEHEPGVGAHLSDGRINAADVGHAVMLSAVQTPVDIHSLAHSYIDTNQFSAQVANKGVTDLKLGNGNIRTNREQILTPNDIAGLVVVENHQIPFPVEDPFDASASFTLVAQQSRGVRPNLTANIAGMAR